jgi:hypothetical protein
VGGRARDFPPHRKKKKQRKQRKQKPREKTENPYLHGAACVPLPAVARAGLAATARAGCMAPFLGGTPSDGEEILTALPKPNTSTNTSPFRSSLSGPPDSLSQRKESPVDRENISSFGKHTCGYLY